jgi:hypothetical protein
VGQKIACSLPGKQAVRDFSRKIPENPGKSWKILVYRMEGKAS